MRRVSGFTLVELLVVIAIMIIIMGFSVPMFSKISFGNAVDGASRMISSQLSLARAEAVAKRQYIAIVMPGKDFNQPADGATTDEYHFRAFRAAIVETTGDTKKFDFVKWFPGTEWGFLPKGAVIAEVDGDAVTTSEDATGFECLEKSPGGELKSRHVAEKWLVGNKLEGDDEDTMTIVKDPNKKSDDEDEDKLPRMVEGVSKNEKVRAIVFQPNGRVVGGNMYVTIVEGVAAENSGYVLSNANKDNMRLMKINQYTGKITYLDVNYDKD